MTTRSYYSQPRPTDEIVLDNGIRIILWPTESKRFNIFFVFDVGHQHVHPMHYGLPHFVEHLMFHGTKDIGVTDYQTVQPYLDQIASIANEIHKAKNIKEIVKIRKKAYAVERQIDKLVNENDFMYLLESSGDIISNAVTFSEVVVYGSSFPRSKMEDAISLYYHKFTDPVFYRFYNEQDVILQEMSRDSYDDVTVFLRHLWQDYYLGHPNIGYKKSLLNITPQVVNDYVKTFYQPKYLTIIITGDVKYEDIIMLKYYFGAWRNHDTLYYTPYYHLKPSLKRQEITYRYHDEGLIAGSFTPITSITERAVGTLLDAVPNALDQLITENMDYVTIRTSKEYLEIFMRYLKDYNKKSYDELIGEFKNRLVNIDIDSIKHQFFCLFADHLRNGSYTFEFFIDTIFGQHLVKVNDIKNIMRAIENLKMEDVLNTMNKLLDTSKMTFMLTSVKSRYKKLFIQENNIDLPFLQSKNHNNDYLISDHIRQIGQESLLSIGIQKIEPKTYSLEIYQKVSNNAYVLSDRYYDDVSCESALTLVMDNRYINRYEERYLHRMFEIISKRVNYPNIQLFTISSSSHFYINIITSQDYVQMFNFFFDVMKQLDNIIQDESFSSEIAEYIYRYFEDADQIDIRNRRLYDAYYVISEYENIGYYENYQDVIVKLKNAPYGHLNMILSKHDLISLLRRLLKYSVVYFHGITNEQIMNNINKVTKFLSQYKSGSYPMIRKVRRSIGYTHELEMRGLGAAHENKILRVYHLGKVDDNSLALAEFISSYAQLSDKRTFSYIMRIENGLSYRPECRVETINSNLFLIFEAGIEPDKLYKARSIFDDAIKSTVKGIQKDDLNKCIKEYKIKSSNIDNPVYRYNYIMMHVNAVSNKLSYLINYKDLLDITESSVKSFIEKNLDLGRYIHIVADI